MNTATLVEVMAEAAKVAECDERMWPVDDQIQHVMNRTMDALTSGGPARREALLRAAAVAILALSTHDSEATKAGS
jgi:hypothetical protein